jgi:hypothetical protein
MRMMSGGRWAGPMQKAALTAVAATVAAVGLAPTPADAAVPGGRTYELVSPVQKDGNAAGAANAAVFYAWSQDDGDGLLYGSSGGAIGASAAGIQSYAVSTRGAAGWTSRNPVPRATSTDYYSLFLQGVFPSADLSTLAFSAQPSFNPDVPEFGQPGHVDGLYLTENSGPATWVDRPTDPSAVKSPYNQRGNIRVAGGSPDLSTLYFSSPDTLVAGEEDRAANLGGGSLGVGVPGFYEYHDGVLAAAGRLPDGSLSAYGAVPAGRPSGSEGSSGPDGFNNQVSRDGSRALFVSPSPDAGSPDPTQLYDRVDGARTELLSRSALTGLPAPAGVVPMADANFAFTAGQTAYMYASRDGSHVYFQSTDQLTSDAPADAAIKGYLYDSADQSVTYLSGIDPGIDPGSGNAQVAVVGMADDGSQLLFVDYGTGSLKSWTASGGVTTVAPLSGGTAFQQVQGTANGSVYVFMTNAVVGTFANPSGHAQVYRYDAFSGDVACLSCLASDPPSGDAFLGPESNLGQNLGYDYALFATPRASHEMSSDGKRVFFDTSDALVPQDTNGQRDVYMWEDGKTSLVSSGRSPQPSFLLDNSASGNDVFFATTEALLPADTDGAYDVYDARVGGGFPNGDEAASCIDTCQGVAPAPSPPLPAATVTFSGAGNLDPGNAPAVVSPATISLGSKRSTGNSIVVKVKVSAEGRLSLRGRAIGTARRTANRAGTYTLTARLTRASVRTLARKGKLALKLRVGYVPAEGRSVTASVSLTAKKG